MVSLAVRSLSKSFGSRRAVRDVSFEVGDGEFCVLLGPSGCGKTTLLRCVAGLEMPDSGDVQFDGASVTQLPVRERDVSMVFQSFALFPLMTVFDNVAFPLRVRSTPREKVERRVEEVANLLRIEGHMDDRPSELSGGERQRVALARAIVREPKLFLLDEPLSSLDAPLRAEMRVELKRLHEKVPVTTLYVTHDQSEALSLADKMGVMSDGSIVQYDTPENVYSKPSHVFVAGFVGSVPANIFDASLSAQGKRSVLKGDGFQLEVQDERLASLVAVGPRKVKVAIRPEDFVLNTGGEEGSLEVTLKLVENLGSAELLEVQAGVSTFRVTTGKTQAFKLGDSFRISPASGRIRLFDPATGLALL